MSIFEEMPAKFYLTAGNSKTTFRVDSVGFGADLRAKDRVFYDKYRSEQNGTISSLKSITTKIDSVIERSKGSILLSGFERHRIPAQTFNVPDL